MIIVNDTAVRADRNVNSRFLEILVTSLCHVDNRSSLSSAYTLGLTGDTDRAAADTDFYKVSSCFSEEAETLTVNDVTCSNLYGV